MKLFLLTPLELLRLVIILFYCLRQYNSILIFLADFDYSAGMEEKRTKVSGSPFWMAPELVNIIFME